MMIKPDDQQTLRDRARRYVRGIAVAIALTFAALLFLYATLYGETTTSVLAEPHAGPRINIDRSVQETGSIPADYTTR